MKKTNKKQAAAWVLSLLPLVMIAAVYCRLRCRCTGISMARSITAQRRSCG